MTQFPGGSKTRVNQAGRKIRCGEATNQDLAIIDEWRAAHRGVLNTFQAILRTRTKNKSITVAQRHKRRSTIFDKLRRYENMELSRMDDVAGCRLIFDNIDDLYEFRSDLHRARFRHRRRNEIDQYDYIKNPKATGYRGIHDIYIYDVNSVTGIPLKGLLVELQYRTLIQHAWATTVEIIGFITENQPKFQRGDERYQTAMILASEILSRAFENMKGAYHELTNRDLLSQFSTLNDEIHLMGTLRAINSTNTEISQNKNSILIFKKSGDLEVRTYRDAPDALKALFELEKESTTEDIVLVRADTSEEVRLAFRNYFTDASEFIHLIDQGCERLLTAPEIV